MARRQVYALLVAGVAAVSTAAVLVKLTTAHPVAVAFYRMALAWLALAPVAARQGALAPAQGRDVLGATLAGLFLAAHYAVWFASLRLTSVASATVLVTTQPVWVALLAYGLWRERSTAGSLAGMAVALLGVYFTGAGARGETGDTLYGNGLALLAAVLASGYLLLGQRLRPRIPLLVYVFWVYGAAAAALGAVALAMGVPLYGYGAREWWIFAALAAVPSLIGHTVLNWALRYVPASVVAVAVLGEPLGATLLAFLVLKEVPGAGQLAGGARILGGVFAFLRLRDVSEGRVQA
ncbi:MAG: DMT family transporter, partial [Firmicutes bacterium]|nr:DMT family transporter [Bacillota bacterium]